MDDDIGGSRTEVFSDPSELANQIMRILLVFTDVGQLRWMEL